MSRLSIEIPDDLHQQIKANASLRGLSLRDFVLQRLGVPAKAGRAEKNANVEQYAREPQPDEPPAPGSMLELIKNRPWQGTMTKAEIDACLAEERASWHDDD